ncbi:unnamed protein product [Symbiodinium natans]|uniref:Uncharacterized protein n=1 Tax=Symbiodinium natans TaxID=878477 RepID=A0A812PWY2_9DINO|nr:unnamed protein product [Symbiodinium natans]
MADAGSLGEVVVRCIDDLQFQVVVLRVHSDTADVLYLDDGKVEPGVPADEIDWQASDGRKLSTDHPFFEAGVEKLVEMEAATTAAFEPTTSNMRWEQGRFREEDGAVVLSSCIAVLMPQVVKDWDSEAAMQACGAGLPEPQ